MKIGIIGASGIGKFHAREYKNLGHEIIGILGSSKESSQKTKKMLLEKFKINTKAYWDLDEFLNQDIDVVSICIPVRLHYEITKRCLEENINVLCEKPLIDLKNQELSLAKELIKISQKRNLILTENTQWPSIIPYFKKYVDLHKIQNFEVIMEPGVKGIDLLYDHLPHANSVLLKLIENRKGEYFCENINFLKKEKEQIVVRFNYVCGDKKDHHKINVTYNFRFKADRPRDVIFRFNDKEFKRKVDENYNQSFIFNDKTIEFEDPLRKSIREFLESIRHKENQLISSENILGNLNIQKQILIEYHKNTKQNQI